MNHHTYHQLSHWLSTESGVHLFIAALTVLILIAIKKCVWG